jgi:sugar O-acyltransferase (sialic acid O-acetyltransferase NeuD family)
VAGQARRVVIIGAGGHGREVAEILQHQARNGDNLEVVGFVDDDQTLRGKKAGGLPVLGDWRWFEGVDRTEVGVICAVGSPNICKLLTDRANGLGLSLVSAISPQALISPSAHFGKGVTIFPNVVVNTEVKIADSCILNVNVTVSHDTMIGRYCNINPAVNLAGNVIVGEGCYVGMGAKVIQGISIGDWSVVGAGAVVVRDIPGSVTAVGVPARIIK